MAQQTDVHLYTTQTPNGTKISILLEELGLKYQTTAIDITKNTQKEPWFLEINPNGRIPALTDKLEDGQTIKLFESGSIMQYLVDRYDKDHKVSYPHGSQEHWEVNNWVFTAAHLYTHSAELANTIINQLFWQMGGLGPMQGQLAYFNRYAPEKIQFSIDRKSPSGYLVGDRCTVADISCWGWVASAGGSGVDITEFPALKEWRDKLLSRPGVEKGRHVPSPHKALEFENMPEEEMKKAFEHNRKWIQASIKEDSK
ncbi:hypothetical protein PG997_013820 [Apiospora hydei]|uniref:Glutathione S-transferase n=1 Tax=Apiospora hydei TaxID=1337664 RepID=A0ABR1V7D2_9PEZI